MTIYKVKKRGKKDITIERSGYTEEMSLKAIKENATALEKIKKEMTAQSSLEAAKMENVVRNHKYVLDRTPEEMNAITIYYKAYELKQQCDEKLKEIKRVEKEWLVEKAAIEKQTGLEI